MTTPDWFGFANPATPKLLSAPSGFSDVHQAGFSWAKQGGTVDETTWIDAEHWNRLIAQMRALLSVPGVDVSDLQVNSNLLLKTFVIRAIQAVLDGTDIEGAGVLTKSVYDPGATGKVALGAGGTGVSATDLADLRDKIGVTAAISAALSGLVDAAPGALDTLNELAAALGDDADFAGTVTTALAAKADATALAARVLFLEPGAALPGSDVGPIWHDDYAAIMTWQTFSANGASYTGYASVDVGMPIMDGHSSPRAGFVKRNGASLSKTTYAPLWNWALHHGRVGSWTAGAFIFGDNGDGTFKVPDNRGEFERAWDDSRGVDSGRALGSAQVATSLFEDRGGGSLGIYGVDGSLGDGVASSTHSVGSRSGVYFDSTAGTWTAHRYAFKPRNVALLACIKF